MKAIIIFAIAAGIPGTHSIGVPEATPVAAVPAQAPFRLVFKAYDGDPQKEDPSKFYFQVDTIDIRQPSEFLRLGEMIPSTTFRLKRFTFKTQWDPEISEKKDVSELTIVNVKTGATVVLIYNRVTDTTMQPLK